MDEIEDKKDALDTLMKKYSSQSSFEYSEADLEGVAVIKIEIDQLTGKKKGTNWTIHGFCLGKSLKSPPNLSNLYPGKRHIILQIGKPCF
ncbi:hypothetical protein [Methanobacterium sp. CWC-01]|uniref:hypothetical protein n=1 Tax=Methanobacterium aridiramus TaxID=2584467 RepID=UPI002574D0F9|nr:hypothetical protein [Methanobacterium sp. CWC-01]